MKESKIKTEDNRTSNSARNISFGMMNKIMTIVLSFVSRQLILRVFSLEYLGISSIFADVLTMLSLADLGLATAMAYSFYKPLAEKDEKKIAALLTFYQRLYNFIAIMVAVIGLALTPFIHYIANVEQEIPHLKIYYLVCLANTVVSYLFVYKSTLIIADQKNHIVSKYATYLATFRTVGQILAIYLTHSYLLYLCLNIVSTVFNNVLLMRYADKHYSYAKKKEILSKDEKREVFYNMKSVFLYKFAQVIMGGTDNIIISSLVSVAAVGLYGNYFNLTNQLGSVSVILFGSLTASVGNLIVKGTTKRRYEVFQSIQMISFLLSGFFVVCLYFLADDFIVLVYKGEQYLLGYTTLIIIVINFYLTITCYPIWSFREATGLYQKVKYVLVATAVVNIICSLVLGRYFGIAGIVAATVIARLSTYFWYEPVILFHDCFRKKVWIYYLGHVKNACCIILSILVLHFLLGYFTQISWIAWVGKGIVCSLVTGIIYVFCYFNTKEFKFILNKVFYLINNKGLSIKKKKHISA